MFKNIEFKEVSVLVTGLLLAVLGYVNGDLTLDAAFQNVLVIGGVAGSLSYVGYSRVKAVKKNSR